MILFTKCILAPKVFEDGVRISVMSRHTLNDGVTADTRITHFAYSLHMRLLGPSSKLIGGYKKKKFSWDEFSRQYLEELKSSRKRAVVEKLAELACKSTITLLCIEETAEFCHRRLLAEECKRYQPQLVIKHR